MGIIFRITEYLHNRSLNEAEAPLAMNLIHRSYSGLLNVKDYIQAALTAPLGFAFMEKSVIGLFGHSEFALRILPLLAGIIGLLLFLEMARRYLDHAIVPIALIFFAANDHLILFSSEAKHYSLDVAIAVGLVMSVLWIVSSERTITRMLLFGLLGAIGFWFSHSAVFVYASGTIIILYSIVRERNWHHLLLIAITTAGAILSLGALYFIELRDLTGDQALLSGFQRSFVPLVPTSPVDLKLLGFCLLRTIKNPMGLSVYELGLATISLIAGMVVILWKRRLLGVFILLTFFLTLFASSLQKYPFEGRLLLFMTPLLIPVLAQGLHYVYTSTKKGSIILALALAAILIFPPVFMATYHLINPRTSEELRPVMHQLRERHRSGDVVYLYYAARNAFQYYAERFKLEHIDYIVGNPARHNQEIYYHELNELRGNDRVWIVFSHIFKRNVDEELLFISYLKSIGTLRESFNAHGAALYLFDLSHIE